MRGCRSCVRTKKTHDGRRDGTDADEKKSERPVDGMFPESENSGDAQVKDQNRVSYLKCSTAINRKPLPISKNTGNVTWQTHKQAD